MPTEQKMDIRWERWWGALELRLGDKLELEKGTLRVYSMETEKV